MLVRVVLAIKEPPYRKRIARLLKDLDVQVDVLTGQELKWDALTRRNADLVIMGESLLPENLDEAFVTLSEAAYPPGIAILLDYDDLYRASSLRASGACGSIYYGLDDPTLGSQLGTVIDERCVLLQKTVTARRLSSRPHLSDFVSASPAMQAFVKMARQVSDSDVAILISGETGVGKERLARAMHEASPRRQGPFIAVNCGAIPETLMESELFGHEEGAYTGATRTRRGCFELAHRGTIFLDEIAEMPAHLQVKLLRVLQDFLVTPVGSEKTIPVDVRVMAATNKNIQEEMEEAAFRKDLFYRLSVIQLELPALRDRIEDIPILVNTFVEEIGARIGKRVAGIRPDAVEALCKYSWPGNIRELINVLERGILLCEGEELVPLDLPEEVRFASSLPGAEIKKPSQELIPSEWLELPLKEIRQRVVDQYEREYLTK
ncbi:MAG: transcriptional regulator with PAS, ATPase and Fis domain, partial [Kiritimatiellia bacterium]